VLGAYVLASSSALGRKIDKLLDDKGVSGTHTHTPTHTYAHTHTQTNTYTHAHTLTFTHVHTHAQVVRMPWMPLAEIMSACAPAPAAGEADIAELKKSRSSLERQIRDAQLTFDVTVESLVSRIVALESAAKDGPARAPRGFGAGASERFQMSTFRATNSPPISSGSLQAFQATGSGATPNVGPHQVQREEPPPLLPHVASAPAHADDPLLKRAAEEDPGTQAGDDSYTVQSSKPDFPDDGDARTLGDMKPLPPPDRKILPGGRVRVIDLRPILLAALCMTYDIDTTAVRAFCQSRYQNKLPLRR
jgi:hypothetical protein